MIIILGHFRVLEILTMLKGFEKKMCTLKYVGTTLMISEISMNI